MTTKVMYELNKVDVEKGHKVVSRVSSKGALPLEYKLEDWQPGRLADLSDFAGDSKILSFLET